MKTKKLEHIEKQIQVLTVEKPMLNNIVGGVIVRYEGTDIIIDGIDGYWLNGKWIIQNTST